MRHIVHRKEENMNYYNEIKNELINNEINRKVKNYSINKSDLNTYYNVGKLLLDAGNQYGEGIIKEYSLKLTEELGLGYSQRNLRNMRQFYKVSQKWQTLSAKLSWSHYCEILWFDDNKFQYYIKITELNNLSIRQLRKRIKSNEYERLPEITKNKLIEQKEANIVEKHLIDVYDVSLDYSFTKKFEHLLKVNDIDCINKEYDEQVTYRLYIDDLSFFDTIQDLTSNRYSKEFIKKEYVPVK